MDGRDQFRSRQRQQVVGALELARPLREAAAAVVGAVERGTLEHRAHRAVEHQDAPAERLTQPCDALAAVHRARIPSAWQMA